jgi:hypothetical protein
MNAIEIEVAVTELSDATFDPVEFPYAFLMAFGNKETTIKRLRSGASNKSDLGGVLQANNLHIAIADSGKVNGLLNSLKNSPATTKGKVRFVVATDGSDFEAEDLETGETVACAFKDFPDHFGFFLPLAGISTIKQIRDSSFDIRATSRLNRLYVELLKDNPDWGTAEHRHEMNHLMARLIFCFFAENTDIFERKKLFINTVEQMSERDSSNTHQVISEIFRSMDTNGSDRSKANLPRWAEAFPYVNGGLFSGSVAVPRFSKISRSYLSHIGGLDWTKINPDIFGSMIQAVADDEERGELGMHYTSVPNILKVLNPLFLDDLRERLEEAGDNSRMLLNLRKRISKIRVFDPACGSGNFLVIAYKQLREIENNINVLRDEAGRASEIPLTNFRGIEIRDFSAEIARLALVIAEYQCDLLYRGQKEALAVFLPLDSRNWITCGNALRLDWLSLCSSNGTSVKILSYDLFRAPVEQAQIDFENEGGETYICGNPPYIGDKLQTDEQKSDLEELFGNISDRWKSFDYICGFFLKAASYINAEPSSSVAFVSTNSICQGVQASQFWQIILKKCCINFAHTSFKWSNLAANNAGVICVIVGLASRGSKNKRIFTNEIARKVENISSYLTVGEEIFVVESRSPISDLTPMTLGNVPKDGGNLLYSTDEAANSSLDCRKYLRPIFGSQEFIRGFFRYCLWISDEDANEARLIPEIAARLVEVSKMRATSKKGPTQAWAERPHRFVEIRSPSYRDVMIVPRVSSENRDYLPVGYLPRGSVVLDSAFALYDAPLWNMAVIASRLHLVWIATVCGKLKTDFRYSNTLGWNTFPIPNLTEKNKSDLSRTAQDILLARESHYPATIADLYDPSEMPENLREAHERNDEILERIFIGRRFRNDTERLEKLFELYTKMTSRSTSNKNKAGITV